MNIHATKIVLKRMLLGSHRRNGSYGVSWWWALNWRSSRCPRFRYYICCSRRLRCPLRRRRILRCPLLGSRTWSRARRIRPSKPSSSKSRLDIIRRRRNNRRFRWWWRSPRRTRRHNRRRRVQPTQPRTTRPQCLNSRRRGRTTTRRRPTLLLIIAIRRRSNSRALRRLAARVFRVGRVRRGRRASSRWDMCVTSNCRPIGVVCAEMCARRAARS
jgi:hypothetical protein